MSLDKPTTVTQVTVTEMGPGASCGPKMPFLRSMAAILKYVEIGLALATSIAGGLGTSAGIYASIVAVIHLIISIVLLMLYFCNCIYQIPRHGLFQFGYYVVIDVALLIAGIVCCVYATEKAENGVAGAFAFGELIAAGFCTYYSFRLWRAVGPNNRSQPMTGLRTFPPASQNPHASEIERAFGATYNDEDDWEDD